MSDLTEKRARRAGEKAFYEPPKVVRVELALAETLSSGCKLGTDPICVGPPITAFSGGS